jgi:hypothetical protein
MVAAAPVASRLSTRAGRIGASLGLLLLCATPRLHAQRTDSARAGVSVPTSPAPAAPDTLNPLARRPPVSPGRAFLMSALVPGWGQATLRRPTAGTIFTAVEAMSIAMLIQSKRELAQARRLSRDSVVDHYEPPAQPGAAPTPVYAPNDFAGRIDARKQAVEDWAALLIFNHLLAGADAFVAAHLWDVPVEVSPNPSGRGAMLRLQLRW